MASEKGPLPRARGLPPSPLRPTCTSPKDALKNLIEVEYEVPARSARRCGRAMADGLRRSSTTTCAPAVTTAPPAEHANSRQADQRPRLTCRSSRATWRRASPRLTWSSSAKFTPDMYHPGLQSRRTTNSTGFWNKEDGHLTILCSSQAPHNFPSGSLSTVLQVPLARHHSRSPWRSAGGFGGKLLARM